MEDFTKLLIFDVLPEVKNLHQSNTQLRISNNTLKMIIGITATIFIIYIIDKNLTDDTDSKKQ